LRTFIPNGKSEEAVAVSMPRGGSGEQIPKGICWPKKYAVDKKNAREDERGA